MKSEPTMVAQWLQKADDDLTAAIRVLQGKKKLIWIACFHSQQAVEKYLKAFLVFKGTVPSRTHDLLELLNDCLQSDASFTFVESFCEYLNPFSVQVRYPEEMNLNLTHAKNAVRAAKEIQSFVKNLVNGKKK